MLPPSPPAPTPSYSSKPSDGRVFLPFFPLVPRLSVRSHSVRGVTNQPANSLLSFLPSLSSSSSSFLPFFLSPQPSHSIPFHSIPFDPIEFSCSNLSNGTQNNGSTITTGESSEREFGAETRHTFLSPSDERGTREQWRADCATFCGIVSRRCVTRTISSVRKRRKEEKRGRIKEAGGEIRRGGRKWKKEVKWGRKKNRGGAAAKARKIGAEERAAWRE